MLYTFLAIIWIHFFADFILQTDKIAKSKSHSWKSLAIHSVIYSIPFLIFGGLFTVITLVSHFIVDAISSRIATKLFLANQRHWFFVTIGADQAIHLSLLIWCATLLLEIS